MTNNTPELTIVIPTKNEEQYIGKLLNSLLKQDYEYIAKIPLYIADAHSTDKTRAVIEKYTSRLNISVIPGGLPAEGRNAGAGRAATPYVLFIDADVELRDKKLIRKALQAMKEENLHCVTTNIVSSYGNMLANVLYFVHNIIQYGSRYVKPLSTGMFMLFDRQKFNELGGFNEKVLYGEDYFLSKDIDRKKFKVLKNSYIVATSRRFKKMGYKKVAYLYLKAIKNYKDERFLYQDH